MPGNKIIIRTAKSSDAEEIANIYRPYVENTAITFEYTAPTSKEMKERIESVLLKYPYLVAETDGKIVGYAYASAFKQRVAYAWSVETSVYVKISEKGKGIGKALYLELEKSLFEMGVCNLCACIAFAQITDEHLDNSSVSFHKHMGYELCAHFHNCANKFGKWYDMVWMEKAISDHSANPEMPAFGKYNHTGNK